MLNFSTVQDVKQENYRAYKKYENRSYDGKKPGFILKTFVERNRVKYEHNIMVYYAFVRSIDLLKPRQDSKKQEVLMIFSLDRTYEIFGYHLQSLMKSLQKQEVEEVYTYSDNLAFERNEPFIQKVEIDYNGDDAEFMEGYYSG